jgi:hypothetical protein
MYIFGFRIEIVWRSGIVIAPREILWPVPVTTLPHQSFFVENRDKLG